MPFVEISIDNGQVTVTECESIKLTQDTISTFWITGLYGYSLEGKLIAKLLHEHELSESKGEKKRRFFVYHHPALMGEPGIDTVPKQVNLIAAEIIKLIPTVLPKDDTLPPFLLGGHSFGALLSSLVAAQLRRFYPYLNCYLILLDGATPDATKKYIKSINNPNRTADLIKIINYAVSLSGLTATYPINEHTLALLNPESWQNCFSIISDAIIKQSPAQEENIGRFLGILQIAKDNFETIPDETEQTDVAHVLGLMTNKTAEKYGSPTCYWGDSVPTKYSSYTPIISEKLALAEHSALITDPENVGELVTHISHFIQEVVAKEFLPGAVKSRRRQRALLDLQESDADPEIIAAVERETTKPPILLPDASLIKKSLSGSMLLFSACATDPGQGAVALHIAQQTNPS